ncbi:MAG: YicC family protein [Clostridiales bacterium]|nr:YicC family protein [Clostridiales bacterium]
MTASMTGFGRGEAFDDKRKITVEIKSVNHRYLDINIRLPRKMNFFETVIRSEIKRRIARGKIDVCVSCEDLVEADTAVKYNKNTAEAYLGYLRSMAEDFGLEDDIRVSSLSRYPDVFTTGDVPVDEDELTGLTMKALTGALDRLIAVRAKEGGELAANLTEKLHHMLINVARIEEREPLIVSEYRARLMAKVQELLGNVQIDENRLATELVIFSDKICTDEETVRLRAHIMSMEDTFKAEGDVGRKLDFIAQEMNREANTILSKANDKETSDIAIEIKTEIEKIREQVQNIE